VIKCCANSANAPKSILDQVHGLGVASPNHDQLRVLSSTAVKTWLMSLPHSREYEHLAPSQRRTFVSIGNSWAGMLARTVAERLGPAEQL
jgi:hypothetical protein